MRAPGHIMRENFSPHGEFGLIVSKYRAEARIRRRAPATPAGETPKNRES